MQNTTSKRLETIRTALGYTKKRMASELCVTEQTYINWVSGKNEPRKIYHILIKKLEQKA